jgi:hypothetical protein
VTVAVWVASIVVTVPASIVAAAPLPPPTVWLPTLTLTVSPLPTTLLMLVEPTTTTLISLMVPPPSRYR